MDKIRDTQSVQTQYQNAGNLKTRSSLHEKYSVNKKGFGNWIFEQYKFHAGDRILELGCGDAGMWRDHVRELPPEVRLLLTDFSIGMLEEAKGSIPPCDAVAFAQIDIQIIPYASHSFDVVIANMMLYHVPDLEKGLLEVRRVLKDGGQFYCATFGEHGITEYIQEVLPNIAATPKSSRAFTLQNGGETLTRYFRSVKRYIYKDRLEVTDTEDLLDYLFSLEEMGQFGSLSREELKTILERNKINGAIRVPKEYGLFVADK